MHDRWVPYLNQDRVQHRMAKHGIRYVVTLSEMTGIGYGGLRNAITSRRHRQPIALADVYVLAELLRDKGEVVEHVVRDITNDAEGDGVPDPPPAKKTKDTQSPPRRSDTEKKTGPKRHDSASAA